MTRLRSTSADTSDAGRKYKAKDVPKVSRPEILTSEASDDLRPLRQSSVAVRALLQQVSSNPSAEEDSAAESSLYEEEVGGGESDEVVEVDGPKKGPKIAPPPAHKKGVKSTRMQVLQEDESESGSDEDGAFDSLHYSYLP